MQAKRQEESTIIKVRRFDARISVLIHDVVFRQIFAFAPCNLDFALGNHACGNINDKRGIVAGWDTDSDRVSACCTAGTAKGHCNSLHSPTATGGNNADTTCVRRRFCILTQSANVTSIDDTYATNIRCFCFLNCTVHRLSSDVMTETVLPIEKHGVRGFPSDFWFNIGNNATTFNAAQICRDAEDSM